MTCVVDGEWCLIFFKCKVVFEHFCVVHSLVFVFPSFFSSFLFCVVFIDLHVKCVWNDQCYYYLAQTLVVKFPWSLCMWSVLDILFDSVLPELGGLIPLAVSSVYFEARVVSNGDSMLQYSPILLSLWGSSFQCSKHNKTSNMPWSLLRVGGREAKGTHMHANSLQVSENKTNAPAM